ncbi:hypothetical protein GUJ93_ZPchr0004g39910 [Zizania palustris]|uniref:Fumarylacetoacetase N-terminal domain-containing protein n=1 Tax=Zizania palustris TaxID=103762 RepID=A0A8J5S6E4_ZIZPA|nr:hypothetical protein GUJ93_ZPchr0004g39910 [Zizania palustris]
MFRVCPSYRPSLFPLSPRLPAPAATAAPPRRRHRAHAASTRQGRDSHFLIQNLSFEVFSRPGATEPLRPTIAIGDFALDLTVVSDDGIFDGAQLTRSLASDSVEDDADLL